MHTVYMIYAQISLIPKSIRSIMPDYYRRPEEMDVMLYTWTDKKKYVKRFLNERKNIFIVKKEELDSVSYNDMNKCLAEYKLGKKEFCENGKILCTNYEYNHVNNYWLLNSQFKTSLIAGNSH